MPIAFERFRLLGTSGQIRNESTRHARLKIEENDPEPVELPPGAEVDVGGDMILEVEIEEP